MYSQERKQSKMPCRLCASVRVETLNPILIYTLRGMQWLRLHCLPHSSSVRTGLAGGEVEIKASRRSPVVIRLGMLVSSKDSLILKIDQTLNPKA